MPEWPRRGCLSPDAGRRIGDTTTFVFFVADGTGGHIFAETLDAQNQNVVRWREIEKTRAADGVTEVQGKEDGGPKGRNRASLFRQ